MAYFKHVSSRPSARRLALVGALVAGALTLTACGGGEDHDMAGMDGDKTSATATTGSEKSPGAGAFNDADVTFAQSMIPHHEQALEMSALADGRASDAEIKKLAGEIEKAQDPEIRTMTGWLKSWGKEVPASDASDSMPGMDHGGDSAMSGMMSEQDMADLKAAKGTEFDRKFAELMIAHHKGAITMAEDEQKNGRDATAKKLAGDVVRTQSAEVDTFQKILDRL
ncbi:DUF305 domain-containing protein [Streptomyces sp. NPDC127033]|uniref:DUF305 domain-containing protein n=1 Tax=Streptomyces sp. NPDC127033 TaxID=3347110 RepID=UPI0036632B71